MSIFTHNIYENIRTRTLILRDGCILLHPPEMDGGIWGTGAWGLPGGGLEPHESLADCARREVLEETGVTVRVGTIAFLQEWVVPHYTRALEEGDGYDYGLEVFHFAYPEEPVPDPRPEKPGDPPARWIPLARAPDLPIWPQQLRDLCQRLYDGEQPAGCPSFLGRLEGTDG